MPSTTNWYCCKCKFGPLNILLDDNCPDCHSARCSLCQVIKTSQRFSYRQGSREMGATSPFPDALMSASNTHNSNMDPTARIFGMSLAGDHPARLLSPLAPSPLAPASMPPILFESGLGTASSTDAPPGHDIFRHGGLTRQRPHAYFCCQCNDGPKLFDIQPVCVSCNHKACPNCRAA
jgi:hypothetical protein